MATTEYTVIGMMVILLASSVLADPDMLQDVCVANLASDVTMNGFACKRHVSADDFFYAGLSQPRSTNNIFGATATQVTVHNITGLNTLGMSMSRIDFAPGGLNPPHLHPRSAEIFFVLEGKLDISFITTDNKLYSKSVKAGELFVYPKGLIHYQINNGKDPAVAVAFFNSQLPGIQRVPNALFASSPSVPNDIPTCKFVDSLHGYMCSLLSLVFPFRNFKHDIRSTSLISNGIPY
ncbi:hypothetical protein L1887_24242 [Cichorium endivia]|nr:hypothetical protein L1887_24242 [Cichorium endivia]